PVSLINTLDIAGKTLGTGHNQHLTLLGGVTSDSFIKNINRGLDGMTANGGLLNGPAPAWAQDCVNVDVGGLLGIDQVVSVDTKCWAVNAAQDNQVIIGDGATAN